MKHGFLFVMVLLMSIYAEDSIGQRIKSTPETKSFEGAKNAFYVELLGNGLIFSANYDLRLVNKFGARLGIGYVGDTGGGGGVLTVPVMGNFLLGKDGKYFEVGAGVTYLSGTGDLFDLSDNSTILGTLSFMYRRQPVDGGFMWKIGLTPFIAEGVFIPYWGGLGIGYCW